MKRSLWIPIVLIAACADSSEEIAPVIDATEVVATDADPSDTPEPEPTDTVDASETVCKNDNDCSDDLHCNGSEQCEPENKDANEFGCITGTPPATTDPTSTDCIVYKCDEDLKTIIEVQLPTGASCDDGNSCTLGETCDSNQQCSGGTPSDAACTDELFCNGVERCDIVLGCQPGSPPKPTGNKPGDCQDMVCDEEQDQFVLAPKPKGSPCFDGVMCTIMDACNDSGQCAGIPKNGLCDDGLWCNGAELCDGVVGCLNGSPPVAPEDTDPTDCVEVGGCDEETQSFKLSSGSDCDDANPCTDETCDSETGECNSIPNDALCDDGLACNGTETCDAQSGCIGGKGSSIDDNVACTVDSCDDETGDIIHTPDDSACEAPTQCNSVATCDPIQGCIPGPPLEKGTSCSLEKPCEGGEVACNGAGYCTCSTDTELCDDLDPCTLDNFSPEENKCVSIQVGVGTTCEDGTFCTVGDTCDENGLCKGTPIECNDNNGCTTDVCNDATGQCVGVPVADGSPCTDNDPLTVNETCLGGTCKGEKELCNDFNVCTTDTFDPINESCVHTEGSIVEISYDVQVGDKKGTSPLTCGSNITVNDIGAGCDLDVNGGLRAYSGSTYGPKVISGCSEVDGTGEEGKTVCCFI